MAWNGSNGNNTNVTSTAKRPVGGAKKGPANPLKLLVEGLLSEDKKTARRIDALNSALLQSISAKTEVVYHSVDDSVTINGEHFIHNGADAVECWRIVTEITSELSLVHREIDI